MTDNPTKWQRLKITLALLAIAVSYTFIQVGDSKLRFPILAGALFMILMPGIHSILGLPIIACWLYTLTAAFATKLIRHWVFIPALIYLWLSIGIVSINYITGPINHESLYFWIPSLVFTIASYWLLLKSQHWY